MLQPIECVYFGGGGGGGGGFPQSPSPYLNVCLSHFALMWPCSL